MTDALSMTNLVKHYFNVCNAALAQTRGGPVLRRAMLARIAELAAGHTVTLEVLDRGSGARLGGYTTRFVRGEFAPVQQDRAADDRGLRFAVSREFLEAVWGDADEYIAHPERLDWSWLREAREAARA